MWWQNSDLAVSFQVVQRKNKNIIFKIEQCFYIGFSSLKKEELIIWHCKRDFFCGFSQSQSNVMLCQGP